MEVERPHQKVSLNTSFARHHHPSTSVTLRYSVVVMP